MKTKFIILLIVSISLFTSCKDNKQDKVETKEVEKITMTISFNAIVKQDDEFQLFYTQDGTENLSGENSILVPVKGNVSPQYIVFELPKDVLPNMIRFDLGGNKNQEEVIFNEFSISYLDKKFNAKGIQLSQFFYENDQIQFNKEKGTAKPIVVEGKEYDPIFMATEVLKEELQKIVK